MKRTGKSSAKVHVDNFNEVDIDREYAPSSDQEMDRLPASVQALLATLKIPHGPQFGKDSDVDPTLGLLNHIIDSVAALRDVVKVYKSKESVFANTVGSRIVTALTGEIGKMLIYSLTNDWEGHEASAGCFHIVSSRILSTFPEIASRQHKVSGKMLLHHTCYKSSSRYTIEYIRSLVDIVPSSVACPDAHGAIPLHWAMRNKNSSVEVIQTLVKAFPAGPRTKDKKGFLPLHWAVHQDSPRVDLVEALLRIYPNAAKEPCDSGGLPVHWAVNQDAVSLPVLKLLIKCYPEGLNSPCSAGWLPVHRAVDRSQPDMNAVRLLIEQHPRALQRPCNDGQLPLHKVVDHMPTSYAAMSLLLETFPNALTVSDKDGYLPLHTALDCAHPNADVVIRLLTEFPDAARRPTLDGLLPLHMAISSTCVPAMAVIELLVDIYPLASQHLAVDSVPEDETANPDLWEGEWVEKKWTPLSRAMDRRLVDIVALMKVGLTKKPTRAATGGASVGSSTSGKLGLQKFVKRPTSRSSNEDSNIDSESESSSFLDQSSGGPPRILAQMRGGAGGHDFEMSDDSVELESKGSSSRRSGRSSSKKKSMKGGGMKFRINVPKYQEGDQKIRTSPLYADRTSAGDGGSGSGSGSLSVQASIMFKLGGIQEAFGPSQSSSPPSARGAATVSSRLQAPSEESPYLQSKAAVTAASASISTSISTAASTSATTPALASVTRVLKDEYDSDTGSVDTHVRVIAPRSSNTAPNTNSNTNSKPQDDRRGSGGGVSGGAGSGVSGGSGSGNGGSISRIGRVGSRTEEFVLTSLEDQGGNGRGATGAGTGAGTGVSELESQRSPQVSIHSNSDKDRDRDRDRDGAGAGGPVQDLENQIRDRPGQLSPPSSATTTSTTTAATGNNSGSGMMAAFTNSIPVPGLLKRVLSTRSREKDRDRDRDSPTHSVTGSSKGGSKDTGGAISTGTGTGTGTGVRRTGPEELV